MATTIQFDPFKTYGVDPGFSVDSDGYVQGDALPDSAVEQQLATGIIDKTVTTPIYPGIGILESIAKDSQLGAGIHPGSDTACNGFVVSNRAMHMMLTPGNTVPQYLSGSSVHYYRLGSLARIPLPVSPAVASLAPGGTVWARPFIWDPVNMWIDEGTGAPTDLKIRLLEVKTSGNLTIDYNSTTGLLSWNTSKPIGIFQI